jgi:HlyD family secretion protein
VQYDQANSAVKVAEAAVAAAEAQLESAEIQHALALQGARLQEWEGRAAAWTVSSPEEVVLPAWYFGQGEQIAALQAEIEAAGTALDLRLAELERKLRDASNDDFVAAETRLAAAQATFEIATLTLVQAQTAVYSETLQVVAQEDYYAALADLKAAQKEYDGMLSSVAAEDILQARAGVAVAQARLDNARDRLTLSLSGEESLQVEAARAAVAQAESAVLQAEAGLAQAQAALQVIQVQLDKTAVTAPVSGVVLSLNLEAGELVAPGATVLTIGQLDRVNLTVYVPEDQYGQVQLGQAVTVSVDSFPGETFRGEVRYIADQAEFTPRNVQTVEGRKTTVYAIRIAVPNVDGKLKPGMPADVEFLTPGS